MESFLRRDSSSHQVGAGIIDDAGFLGDSGIGY